MILVKMSVVAVAVGLSGGRWHRNCNPSPNSDPNLRDEVKNFTEDQDCQKTRHLEETMKAQEIKRKVVAKAQRLARHYEDSIRELERRNETRSLLDRFEDD